MFRQSNMIKSYIFQVVSPTVKVEDFIMTGVGPMTRQDVKTLSTTHPTLSKFCSRSRDDRVVDIVDARTVVHAGNSSSYFLFVFYFIFFILPNLH